MTPSRNRAWLEKGVRERMGFRLGPANAHPNSLPPDIVVSDGLEVDEAVAVALWRSPALQAELTALDSALADFDEARRPPNPRLNFLAPVDPRQLSLILFLPIDAIWQLPFRAQAANRELERVAESLVQTALDTERDVRAAHADALLAQAKVAARKKIFAAWADAAHLAEGRARAGDIAPAEAASVRAENEIAKDAANRAGHDQTIADSRLLALLGAPWPTLPRLVATPASFSNLPSEADLRTIALRERAELRAAALAMHAAAARGRWERSRIVSLVATIDGQADRGAYTPQFSAGAQQVELPIFSQNQGGVGRTNAQVARAGYRYAATRISVAMEVTASRAALLRAQESIVTYDRVVNAIDESSRAATRAFENGAESYLVVIDALRRATDVHLRRVELDNELDRANAELYRVIGGRRFLEAK